MPDRAGLGQGHTDLGRRRSRRQTEGVFTHVLVGYDGSAGSSRALVAGLRIAAEGSKVRVTAVTVQHHLPRYGATIGEVDEERLVEAAEARRLANEIDAVADEQGVSVSHVVVPGHPAHEIVRAAEKVGADLIVLGHSGHSALHDRLLGSVVENVSRHAHCSVLIVR